MQIIKGHLHRLLREAKGAAAVEFAILGTVFILFLGGILDFGHAWYMRQVVTNASREGARYGVTYRTDSQRSPPRPQRLVPNYQDLLEERLFGERHITG